MPFDPDDPRLTAYALGELDEAGRAEVEAQLDGCPESRRVVAEVCAAAKLLQDQLRAEPSPGLADQHRRAIEERLEAKPAPVRPPGRSRSRVRFYALAASLFAGACALTLTLNRYTEMRTAQAPSGRYAADNMWAKVGAMPPGAAASAPKLAEPSPAASPATPMPPAARRRQQFSRAEQEALVQQQSFAQPPSSGMLGMSGGMGGRGGMMGGYGGMMGDPGPMGATMGRAAGPASTAQPIYRGLSTGQQQDQPGLATSEAGQAQPADRSTALSLAVDAERKVIGPMGGGAMMGGMMMDPAAAVDRRDQFGLDLAPRRLAAAEFNTEAYNRIKDNPFVPTSRENVSTFSIDVDTASYANVRRFLRQGMMPPKDAVRIEEMVNYFSYDDPAPTGDDAFAVTAEVAGCPWNAEHRLLRVALKGREVDLDNRPAGNFVFLVDVSGSMRDPDKLDLLKAALPMLVEQLGENDRVAIVTYANGTRVVLPSTGGDRKREILSAIDSLQAAGSTNGGAGIQLAYDAAVAGFVRGGTNRVILATDGDFNVGVTSDAELERLIEEKAKTGVFLSILGVGQGNLQDAKMEMLADKGNGNYAYLDTLAEARKVLVEELGGTLVAIAKDVKVQVDFNPAKVGAYRLVGYENRLLNNEDFADDTKDAGEIGAGHSVVAFYELIPPEKLADQVGNQQLAEAESRYRKAKADLVPSDELLTVRLRHKEPEGEKSALIERPVRDSGRSFSEAGPDFQFSAAVASFAMLLRDSAHKGSLTFGGVLELASPAVGPDPLGYRREFLDMVQRARSIAGQ